MISKKAVSSAIFKKSLIDSCGIQIKQNCGFLLCGAFNLWQRTTNYRKLYERIIITNNNHSYIKDFASKEGTNNFIVLLDVRVLRNESFFKNFFISNCLLFRHYKNFNKFSSFDRKIYFSFDQWKIFFSTLHFCILSYKSPLYLSMLR